MPRAGGLPFHKLSGGGNDFILIDAREPVAGLEPQALARLLCPRAHGVGADGLIVVSPASEADLALAYFNADGSRAFCGNGTLCVARWAHQAAGLPAALRLETDQGVVPARVRGRRVEMEFRPPRGLRQGITLEPAGMEGSGLFLDTGCPHLVVLVDALPDPEVFLSQARRLRRHPGLGDAGTNVDFVMVEDPHRLRLWTFERGVEGETLASGTGCLAAALAAASRSLAASPVTCLTRGGIPLKVRFRRRGADFTWVSLEGEARLVYRGVTSPDLDWTGGPGSGRQAG
ncbi:MAG: diaminopimelate epimerase [Acidobacteriota bacterium]